jgi:hypothetical protein
VWNAAFDAVDRKSPVVNQVISLFGSVSRYHAKQPKIAATYFLELNVALRSVEGLDDILQMIFDGLERVLADAQDDDRLERGVETAVLARNLFAIWNFVMVYRFSHEGSSDEAAQERLERSLTVALAGLVP